MVEMLVVIAIIMILASIIMPALKRAVDVAYTAACLANLNSCGAAMSMFVDDHNASFTTGVPGFYLGDNGYFANLTTYPGDAGGSYWKVRWCNDKMNLNKHPEYGGAMWPYLQNAKALMCPVFGTLAESGTEDPVNVSSPALLGGDYKPWLNYSINEFLGTDFCGESIMIMAKVPQPSETFSFTEESCRVDPAYSESGMNDTAMIVGYEPYGYKMVTNWIAAAGGNWRNVKIGPSGVGKAWDVIASYHNTPRDAPFYGKGNCVFLDGHAASHDREDSFILAYPLRPAPKP